MMKVESFVCNEWQENCYVLYDESKEAAIVDCGARSQRDFDRISYFVERMGLKPVALLSTHLHLDHVFGNGKVLDKWGLLTQAGIADKFLIDDWDNITAAFGITGVPAPPAPGKYLSEGNIVRFGISELKVFETPGHSPGSLCFYSEADNVLFSGDVLFANGVGRSDFVGGDPNALYNSIVSKLFTLPDETVVYTGHGMTTTIGYEKDNNPYI